MTTPVAPTTPATPVAPATPVQPPASQPPAQPQQPGQVATLPPAEPQFAGKFVDGAALEQGIVEARKHLGLGDLPEGVKLVGDGGIYTSHQAAELAYKDYQSQISRGQQQAPVNTDPLNIDPAKTADANAKTIIEAAGLDNSELVSQFGQHGKLTDEQYTAFQKAVPGLTKAMIDQFAAGEQAKGTLAQQSAGQARSEAVTIVGGEQQLNTLFQFAAANIPANELGDAAKPEPGTINHRLSQPHLFKGAIAELMSRHSAAVGAGNAQPLASGQPSQGTYSPPFASKVEYYAAQAESRKKFGHWNKDPQFMARLKATPQKIIRV